MAETLLTDLFKEVGSIVFQVAKQEINLLVGVDEEVQQLRGKLGMIKAMLDDAEERHAVKLRTEKLWLEQLQNQYYKMDDILDTWNTARIRAEIEKDEGKPADTNAPTVVKKKVCSFVPSPSCCFKLHLRHDVGHMIRKLNVKLDMVLKDKAAYGIDFNRQPDVVERPITTPFANVSHVIGLGTYRNDLLKYLLGVGGLVEGNSCCVISLVGMGGIGKTTLAQLAYNHPDVQVHFQKRMWICVSDPFDQCKVAKAIINEVRPGHEQGPLHGIELPTLLSTITSLIKDMKFFLVLDDVWTEDSRTWEPFKQVLENGIHGSRILVTTRKERVAEVMGSVEMIRLKQLSEEDCWSIFSKIAFSNEEQLKHLEDLGRELARKCKGLPLAAKSLASLMQNKRREEWQKILGSSWWESEDIEKGLLAPLFLSYYDLPPTVRRCFLYCAVFAKDYLFCRDELVLHWMAQGYIESKADMELEDIAEEYFEKLAMRSFFQDFKKDKHNDDKIIGCKMHDIVHNFAQFMTKNESFEVDGDMKSEIDCQSARHLHLKISKEIQSLESINCAKNLRTLYLSHEMDKEFRNRQTHHLHVMENEFTNLFSNSFRNFKCLRTLILDCPITELPDAVDSLIHLRCLQMSEKVKIVELPETFCNLCNLQTLNIENSSCFRELPQGISKLINLRHFIFRDGDNYKWRNFVFPKGIGKLISLRTLSRFNVSGKDGEGCKFGELKNLNQLQGFLTIGGMENVVNIDEAQSIQMEDKGRLRGLVLLFETYGLPEYEKDIRTENAENVLTALKPPPNLEYLEIRGYPGCKIYLKQMMSSITLKKLQLISCENLEDLVSLGQLPFLEVLVIKWLPNVKKVGDEFLGVEDSNNKKVYDIVFRSLKSLQFKDLRRWEEWIGMGGTGEAENDNGIVINPIRIKIVPCLESLKIERCPNLKSLPDYLLTASLLKELDISYSKLLEECYNRTGEGWHKISRIANIKLGGNYLKRDGKPHFFSEFRGTSGRIDMKNVGNVDEAQIAQLKDNIHLRQLDLVFGTLDFNKMEKSLQKKSRMENDVEVLEALELPPNLQCLIIRGYTGNTIYPNGMMSLTTLKILRLIDCRNLQHLPSLGQLQLLEELEIVRLENVKKVGREFLGIEDSKNKKDYDYVFRSLKSLEFLGLCDWEEWIGMGGEEENDNRIVTNIIIMPCLQSLKITNCNKLKSLPDYLPLTPLLELEISHSQLLEERYPRGTRENSDKISRNFKINVGGVDAQRDPQFVSKMNSFYNFSVEEDDGSEISREADVCNISEEDDVAKISEEDDVVKGDL